MSELCLHRGRARFTIDLHPSTAGDVLAGIREQLQQLLYKYSYDLKGIPLSYNSLTVSSVQAPIGSYFPYLKVTVTADVLLFRPEVGSRLTGTVGTVGADYLGLLVLGLFNAVVGRERIPAHLRCRPAQGCWASDTDRRLRLEVGTPVDFVVAQVHEEQDLFAISGSLLEPGTGISASAGAGTAAAAPGRTAATLAAAPQQAAAAALRVPFSAGRPRVVAATLAPAVAAETLAAVPKQPGTEAGAPAADQPAGPAATDKAARKRDRPGPLPCEDGNHAAPDGERKKKKKRKRQDGMAAQRAPASAQPAAPASVHVTANAAEATGDGRDAAPDCNQRQHKKRRRDREPAANAGVAPAASSDAHSKPQQVNGPIPATHGEMPPMKKRKKRRREEATVTAVRTVEAPSEQVAELADDGMTERKKQKKQKRLADAEAAELPNGFHNTASMKPKAQTPQLAPQASQTAGRSLPNGVMPHQDSLARKKLKMKHGQRAAGDTVAQ